MTAEKEMTDDEMKSVDELRKRMKEDMEPEMYENRRLFWKFLKARDFNVDDTEAMLRKHLEWREKCDVKNTLSYKKQEVVEKYLSYPVLGYDKEGNIVRYAPLGNLDLVGFSNSLKPSDVEKTLIYELEYEEAKLREQSKKLGKTVDQCIYIYNLENLSFAAVTDKKIICYLISFLQIFQDNYPEKLKKAYVLNSSVYFTMVYGILKRILPKTILDKILIYSDDSYKEDILKEIDPEVLPAFLGGTRTDPDGNPMCKTFINHGEPIPEKYYIHKSKRSLSSLPDVKKITLSRAAFHEEILDVKEPGSYLEWEFETKSRDIGFGVFLQDAVNGKEQMIELIPHQRIDTEEYSETGTYMCEKPGKYIFLFDNTYSWIRSKEIYFRIKVVTPQEQESGFKYE